MLWPLLVPLRLLVVALANLLLGDAHALRDAATTVAALGGERVLALALGVPDIR